MKLVKKDESGKNPFHFWSRISAAVLNVDLSIVYDTLVMDIPRLGVQLNELIR